MRLFVGRKQKQLQKAEIDTLQKTCLDLKKDYLDLKKENDHLTTYKFALDRLAEFSANGMQIIGLEACNHCYYVTVTTVIPKERDVGYRDDMTIYLFKLPHTHVMEKLAWMYAEIHSSCRVEIVDWFAQPVNQGYGTRLLKTAIEHFRNAGFQTMYGQIRPVDFDHEDMLRHLYEKFGFQITDCGDHRNIHLDLRKDARQPVWKDECELCIRAGQYSSVKYENESSSKNMIPEDGVE